MVDSTIYISGLCRRGFLNVPFGNVCSACRRSYNFLVVVIYDLCDLLRANMCISVITFVIFHVSLLNKTSHFPPYEKLHPFLLWEIYGEKNNQHTGQIVI